MDRSIIVVTSRQRPHWVMICVAWSAGIGALRLAGWPPAPALAKTLTVWEVTGWYGLTGTAGLLGLAALAIAHPAWTLIVESAAQWASGAAMGIYAVAAFHIGGRDGVVGGLFFASWTVACLWRVAQINGDLKRIRRAHADR
jgi:hypothetical protein